ncbi:MAG: hypothetical protein V4850_03230 [Myxococcota bacterium]
MWLLVGCSAPVLPEVDAPADEPKVEPTVPDSDEPDSEEPDEPDPEPIDTSVTPERIGDRWRFAGADTVLEIDPTLGARVTRFGVGGVEVLTGASVNTTNFGATFWTSPQADWGWPPVEAIDSAPYTATLDGDTLVLTSGAASLGDTTVTVEKRVSVDTTGVTLAYTVHNVGDAAVTLAGWEVARVPTGGLTFFRAGTSMTSTVGTFPAEERGGIVWFDGAAPRSGDTKLVADGSGGWLAHVVDGVLFVETFADIAAQDQAPSEGEIELFAAEDYVELENQGALTTIAPGEGVTHTVRWLAQTVPEGVAVGVGSEGLVGSAETLSGGGGS